MNWTRMIRNSHRGRRPACLRIESLEKRELLHGRTPVWAELPQLTLSFAPDGVDIAGEANVLSKTFDEGLGDEDWRRTIAKAFQTWAVNTNANIGIVDEQGSFEFGTSGARIGDQRFGDIRIGARSLGNDVAAVSISTDSLVSGTWAGDVIFNSDVVFENSDELFSVALHEAGHVFGLDHSVESDSAMHIHGVSDSNTLSSEDVNALVSLYGRRNRDVYEGRSDNDRIYTAVPVRLNRHDEGVLGSAPSVLFADISSHDDADFFRIRPLRGYDGPVTVRVTTSGLSLLEPSLTIYDEWGRQRYQSSSGSFADGFAEFRIDVGSSTLFAKIDSRRDDVFGIGSYSLSVIFDDVNEIDLAEIDQIPANRFAQLDEEEFEQLFNSGGRWARNDHHTDDDSQSAADFRHSIRSEELVTLSVVGSISDSRDVDFYRFESPGGHFSNSSTAFVSIRALEFGGLIPSLSIFDRQRNNIEFETLVNGNGEMLIQLHDVPRDSSFTISVYSTAELSRHQVGNYELNVIFAKEPIEQQIFAEGQITDMAVTANLHVATAQLFHFAVSVEESDEKTAVLVDIVDDHNDVIHRLVSPQGERRTSGSTLLLPGTYSVRAIPLRLNDVSSTMDFVVSGSVISDPFGIDPVLPDDTEFDCPGLDDVFCYPSGTESSVPFDWEEFWFVLEDLKIDAAEVNDALLSEWWSSYWTNSNAADPPSAKSENYTVENNRPLSVLADSGVLANDASASDIIVATVSSQPMHGTIELDVDGSFVYLPESGYTGFDSFEYITSDLRNHSAPTTVTIAVGISFPTGDLNSDSRVDYSDIDELSFAVRGGHDVDQFDLNKDGTLDTADHKFLIQVIFGTSFGDANLDGQFDSSDFVSVFKSGQFEDGSTNVSWNEGDWNGDGLFSSSDLVLAFQHGGYVSSTLAAAAASLDDDSAERNVTAGSRLS